MRETYFKNEFNDNGNKYIGSLFKLKDSEDSLSKFMHGYGKLTYENGDIYEG